MEQFFHRTKHQTFSDIEQGHLVQGEPGCKYTVCLEVPSKQELLELVTNSNNKIEINCGIAICSEEDNFSRKIGREISSSRKTPLSFTLLSYEGLIENTDSKIQYSHTLIMTSNTIIVKLLLTDSVFRAMFVDAVI